MSLFSKILEKLGLKKDQPAETAGTVSAAPKPAAGPVKPVVTAAPAKPVAQPAKPAAPASATAKNLRHMAKDDAMENMPAVAPKPAPKPVAILEVDVVAKLEGLAAAQPLKLNWKTSMAYPDGLESFPVIHVYAAS